MKSLLVIALAIGFCVTGLAYPQHQYFDLPAPLTLGERGMTSLSFGAAQNQFSARLARAIGSCLDVYLDVSQSDIFSLGLRLRLLGGSGPMSAVVSVEADQARFCAGIFLGPVWLDWGRSVGQDESRWAALVLSPHKLFSGVIGFDIQSGSVSPIVGIRFFSTRVIGHSSLMVRKGKPRLSVGALL